MPSPYRMLDEGRAPNKRGQPGEPGPVTELRRALGDLAEVRSYTDAKQPILAPGVRIAVRQWLVELQSQEELTAVGTKPRKTILLKGMPGTGKTSLAHHLAARLGIPMVVVGPENLIGKYLGDSSKSIAALFDALKAAKAGAVVFMDEIDALGASRDSHGSDSSAGSERQSAMTVLLRKFEEHDGILIAATNRPEALDSAFWRRFDIQLEVGLPEHNERFAIIKMYGRPYEFADDEALHMLAELTEDASPSLLEKLMLGVKRSLIINPKMDVPTDDPADVFRPILEALQPPPGMPVPPLWTDSGLQALADLRPYWPPVLQIQGQPPPK